MVEEATWKPNAMEQLKGKTIDRINYIIFNDADEDRRRLCIDEIIFTDGSFIQADNDVYEMAYMVTLAEE